MKSALLVGVAALLFSATGHAQPVHGRTLGGPESARQDDIIVTAARDETFAGTKTETPLIEVPQPITVITADQFLSQGAINISDTVRYAAGITTNAYGRDTRVDGFIVRGIDALQFRDGMRDIFSYYAGITSDPYNFSRVEIVRGPASVLFGQGSIGGLVNLVSKTPEFDSFGEVAATYGSYDRREAFADLNVALAGNLAVRAVGRVRDADTYVDHVPDNRVMFAPSIRWKPGPDTDITLLGLYQEDDGGTTSQFLPRVGTQRPNPNNPARLPRYLFVGSPGFDRYSGRSLQGGGRIEQRFGDAVKISLKARYIDNDLSYFTHYTDSYSNPENPYVGPAGRLIGLVSDTSYAGSNVFSTDDNVQFAFNTGVNIEHTLLVGADYSSSKIRKQYNSDPATSYQAVDLYDLDYDAVFTPLPDGPVVREGQKQLGLYVQDQVRFYDRVSVVVGARHDRVRTRGTGIDKATTFRAGIIGEVGAGLSPFFSYTESFLPVSGSDSSGDPLRPQTGRQFEAGVKWQPDPSTLVTVTAFHIKERNRPLFGPGSIVTQSGQLTTRGIEIEASRTLPADFELLVNYGYNKLRSNDGAAFNYLPRQNASVWTTKTFGIPDGATLRLGAGVRYTGKSLSTGAVGTVVTSDYTQVDGLAEILWRNLRFTLNATNLLDNRAFASCLARGDCFVNAPRNVMGTVGYRF